MNEKQKRQNCREQAKNRNPTVQSLPLPKNHKCYGCVWYPRDVDVLYCPFQKCVRYRKGFSAGEEQR